MLHVEGLTAGYGKVVAVHEVSLDIEEGEIVALIGPNGAGKSTLLRAIAGVVAPSAGRVVLRGRHITGFPSHRVARLGLRLVPEGRGLLGRMTVHENLLLGQHGAGDHGAQDILERVLDRFPVLRARLHQRAGTLSGGEQQQLVIARALVAQPRLVMIDEPSLGLAPLLVREIFGILAELRRDGLTVLLVEQNARQALRIADRAYLLETGRIVRAAPASELLASQAVIQAYLGGA
ncbi:MAG TPA: ABC transporter ATP-binding protein [Methylomirabilota bacterium]|nr:ABC transporter ATP-binding protein [Methylomirabilota bacterium]